MSDAVLRVVKCWSGWRSDCSNTFWRKCTTITKIYVLCSTVPKWGNIRTSALSLAEVDQFGGIVRWTGERNSGVPPSVSGRTHFAHSHSCTGHGTDFEVAQLVPWDPSPSTSGIQFHRPQLCLVVELAQDGQCLLAMTAIFWLIRFERLVMKCNESDYKSKSILGIN